MLYWRAIRVGAERHLALFKEVLGESYTRRLPTENTARRSRNQVLLRLNLEVKLNAILATSPAVKKRLRRNILPPHTKILAAEDSPDRP
ncbi:MAG TPA: hypothetical protein DCE44_01090 [Verrucomicrobiales bacterium]|nr:hypothetical protein [Verrucomicrobiales bacterium]